MSFFAGTFDLLDNLQFNKYLLQNVDSSLHLLLGVRSHECETHKSVLRSTCRRNYRIDEHAVFVSAGSDNARLLHIVNLKRNDRAFSLANLEALLAETLQSILRNVPQSLDALRLLLQDVQCLKGGSGSGRSV